LRTILTRFRRKEKKNFSGNFQLRSSQKRKKEEKKKKVDFDQKFN